MNICAEGMTSDEWGRARVIMCACGVQERLWSNAGRTQRNARREQKLTQAPREVGVRKRPIPCVDHPFKNP